MKEMYLAISERLEQKVSEILYVDLDTGQLDAYDHQPPPVEFPCAMIDIEYGKCEDESNFAQQCAVKVTVRLAFEAWADETSSATPIQWRERALAKMDIPDKVYCALQGWGTDEFSGLSRTSTRPEKRSDGLKVYRIEFETTMSDAAR